MYRVRQKAWGIEAHHLVGPTLRLEEIIASPERTGERQPAGGGLERLEMSRALLKLLGDRRRKGRRSEEGRNFYTCPE